MHNNHSSLSHLTGILLAAVGALLMLLSLGGCEKTPQENEEPELSIGEQRKELCSNLLQAIGQNATRWYSSFERDSSGGVLHLSGGKDLEIPSSVLFVYDKVPTIGKRNGKWTVNGADTEFWVNGEGASPEECLAVCAWQGENIFTVYLDNGTTLNFVQGVQYLLGDVKVLREHNPALEEDVSLKKDGVNYTGKCSVKSQGTLLVPSFECYGTQVSVDSSPLVSGESAVDFSGPVSLSVTDYDGKTYIFTLTLSVKEPYAPENETRTKGKMPILRINTDSGQGIYSKEEYVGATIVMEDPDGWYSDVASLSVHSKIRGRGQSSWGMPKKPYRIKFDEKDKVFGMKSEKDWVLIANYSDKTLLRNTVGFRVSEICSMAWTPEVRACEVYLNNSYIGSYILAEHKEVSKNKVNINPAEPTAVGVEEVQGDYYLEVETSEFDEGSPYCFWSKVYSMPFNYNDPEEPVKEQRDYVYNYIAEAEAALQKGDYAKVWQMIDMDSFVNYYIIEELAKNIDGNLRKSTFMTKEKGRPLRIYHTWDFDLSFGNCDYLDTEFSGNYDRNNGPTGWFIKEVGRLGYGKGWYPAMFVDPAFRSAVKKRWEEVYPQLSRIPDFIEYEARINRTSYDHNFERWRILGTYVWPNRTVPGTYDGEIADLKSFYSQRLEWLNRNIPTL